MPLNPLAPPPKAPVAPNTTYAGATQSQIDALLAIYASQQQAYAAEMSAWIADQNAHVQEATAAGNDKLARDLATQADAEAAKLRQWQEQESTRTRAGELAQTGKEGEEARALETLKQGFAGTESAAERAARIAELEKTIGGQKEMEALRQSGALTEQERELGFKATDSAAERQARISELEKTIGGQQALEALRQSGSLQSQREGQTFQGGESAAERAARMSELTQTQSGLSALETLKQRGAMELQGGDAAGQMQRLQATIQSQQGMATQEQESELRRLREQLTAQASESAAERTARMAELQQTQSGTKELAGYQSQLQKELEDARYGRSKEESEAAFGRSQELLTRFGIGGADSGGGDWFSSMMGGGATTGGTAGAGGASASASSLGPSAAMDKSVEDQVWARAKDKIGQSNEAGIRGLSEEMAARGIKGSGIEAQQIGALQAAGQGELANTATTAAMETLKRRYQTADSDKALAIQKRGQDIGLIGSLTGSYRPSSSGGVY